MELRYCLEFLKRFLIGYIFIINLGSASTSHFSLFKDNHCSVDKDYLYLTNKDIHHLEKKTDLSLNSKILKRFSLKCSGRRSYAYVLNDKVRTHYQTILLWIDRNRVVGADVLEFNEPKKYNSPVAWREKLINKSVKNYLTVDALSGATLTRKSTLKLVKKALVLDKVFSNDKK